MVELAGQILDGERLLAGAEVQGGGEVIDLRFGQDGAGGGVEFGFAESFDVIALHDAHGAQAGQAERFVEIVEEVARLGVVGGLFFNEDAVHQRRG